MARSVLVIMGILWLVFGVPALLAPSAVVGAVGIDLASPAALTEGGAMFGGAQIGIGLFFVYCGLSGEHRAGLVALIAIAAGFGLARILGIAVHGGSSAYTFATLAFDVIAIAAGGWTLARQGA